MRILGAQELVSTLLSLCNLAAHMQCIWGLVRSCVKMGGYLAGSLEGSKAAGGAARAKEWKDGGDAKQQEGGRRCGARQGSIRVGAVGRFGLAVQAYPFLPMWILYATVHINAWVWSAVFHVRYD